MKPAKKPSRADAPTREELVKSLQLLRPEIFQSLRPHGNTIWLPHILVGAALLWVWSVEPTLGGRFEAALPTLARWFPSPMIATTYQGFIKALMKWSPCLVSLVLDVLRARMATLPGHWLVNGWLCFVVDGSKIDLPWTAAHEAEFGMGVVKSKQRPRKRVNPTKPPKDPRPQAFLTMLWHLGSGLPWGWLIGPVNTSERNALRDMLHILPPGALLVADAGFAGYDLWRQIFDGGRHLVFRVGKNVQLLKNLGYRVLTSGETVYIWPEHARRRQEPPLVLRRVMFRTAKTTVQLLTDLTPEQLSDKQVVDLYKRRWGIEGFFRGFKQTFERRKLLSESPAQARCELEWSLIGFWLACQVSADELLRVGESPQRISVAGVIRAVRRACVSPDTTQCEWRRALAGAVKDNYKRHSKKLCHHVIRRKRFKPCGDPTIVEATAKQRRDAEQLFVLQSVA